jgi:hypothetical protein
MIQHYNRKSFYFGIPGLILQIAGNITTNFFKEQFPLAAIGVLALFAGTGLLIAGFAYYAKAKGRHPAWCLMALLSIIGLIILGLLKDKSVQASTEVLQESNS